MGLSDVIYDSMIEMLKELSTYDYWLEKREEIVELLAVQLEVMKKLEGFPYKATKKDFLQWANHDLDAFIEQLEESDED
jgi:hypothetical protein